MAAAKPLAYLALNWGVPVTRGTLVSELWPEAEHSVGLNRLRVSLTRMKGVMGDGIRLDEEGIWLDPELVEVDTQTVLEELATVGDHFGNEDEVRALSEIVGRMDLELLEGMEGEWLDERRRDWDFKVAETCERLAMAAWECEQFETVLEATRVGLKRLPADEKLIRMHLMARGARDEGAVGWAEYVQWRGNAREQLGRDFSKDLVELALTVQSGAFYRDRQGDQPGEKDVLYFGETLAALMKTDKALVADVLGSPSVKAVATKWINTAIPLLTRVLEDADWTRRSVVSCAELLTQLYSVRYEWDKTLNWGTKVVEASEDPNSRALMYRSMAFAYMQMRQFEKAVETGQNAVDLAEKHGSLADLGSYVMNMGSIYMHTAEHEKGIETYERAIEILGRAEGWSARLNQSVAHLNVGCIYLMQEKNADAIERMKIGQSGLADIGYTVGDDMILGMLGYLMVEEGDEEEGVNTLIKGLKLSYLHSSYRPQQLNLELAAGALTRLGDFEAAKGILDWVNEWRIATEHRRSPGELMYIRRFEARIGKERGVSLQNQLVKDVCNFTARRMRAALKARA